MAMQFPEPVIKTFEPANGVRIHTFIGPEAFFSTSAHVIESLHELIVVDGHLVVYYANAFRNYINGLKKPISRVYLSHHHNDHFFGLSAAFADTNMYALPETIKFLEEEGEAERKMYAERFGDGVPKAVVIPSHVVTPGEETIDGIRYEFVRVIDAEVNAQLVIKLPDFGIAILQDLLYSGGHVYIENLETGNWISFLRDMIASDYSLFLAGHGNPADKKELQANIDYLIFASELAKKSGNDSAAYKSALLAAYPKRLIPRIIDVYIPRLFMM